jgi:F-type H+-transporting ATPase subunit a
VEHPYLYVQAIFAMFGPGAEEWAFHHIHVLYSWVVMAMLLGLGFLSTRALALVPGKGQNVMEVLIDGLENFLVSIVGEEGRWLLPVSATIFLYIFLSNLVGLVPGFFPPTGNVNTPLSCALVVFFLTHAIGIKYHGIKYIKHFTGPSIFLAPLFLVIEIVGHLSRVLSLTFRLFGNISGKELVLGILFMLGGAFFAPLPMLVLGIFVSLVQAIVFFLLSSVYFAGSLEHAH